MEELSAPQQGWCPWQLQKLWLEEREGSHLLPHDGEIRFSYNCSPVFLAHEGTQFLSTLLMLLLCLEVGGSQAALV